jgi:hypothetical protein
MSDQDNSSSSEAILWPLVEEVLNFYGLPLTTVVERDMRRVTMAARPDRWGVIANVNLREDPARLVVNAAVLSLECDRELSPGDQFEYSMAASGVAPGRLIQKGDMFYFATLLSYNHQQKQLSEKDILYAMGMIEAVQDSLAKLKDFTSEDQEEGGVPRKTTGSLQVFHDVERMPEIRMRPGEAALIHAILRTLPPPIQAIDVAFMEGLEKAGLTMSTTTNMVVFDALSGRGGHTRLAYLLPYRPGRTDTFRQNSYTIGLAWKVLEKWALFKEGAFETYRQTVESIAPLRLTGSSAYLEVDEGFTLQKVRKLVKAIKTMAEKILPEPDYQKPKQVSSASRIAESVAGISAETGAVVRLLVDGWQAAGGNVVCSRVGYIQLKFKNQKWQNFYSFTLAAISLPAGKPGYITMSWNLANPEKLYDAYLLDQPSKVAKYEKAVAGLPGFTQKDTATRLQPIKRLGVKDAQALLEAMKGLLGS